MNTRLKRVLAFAMLACVLFIVIHPVLDLPDTTLRSSSLAFTVFYAMTVAFFSAELFFAAAFRAQSRLTPSQPKNIGHDTLSALRC